MQGRHTKNLCFSIFPKNLSPNQASEEYFFFIVCELIPFVIYFLLQKPHDCFVCLGKDPDRRFSMF